MAVISIKNKTKSGSLLNGNAPFIPSDYESIATASGSGVSSVTFSSIPQTYSALQIRTLSRESTGGLGFTTLTLGMNGNTTSTNYTLHRLYGNGTSVTAGGFDSTGGIAGGYVNFSVAGSITSSSVFGASIIDIQDYANTTKNKTVRYIAGGDSNGAATGFINIGSYLYLQTTAITSITLTTANTMAAGSTFALYGIKGA